MRALLGRQWTSRFYVPGPRRDPSSETPGLLYDSPRLRRTDCCCAVLHVCHRERAPWGICRARHRHAGGQGRGGRAWLWSRRGVRGSYTIAVELTPFGRSQRDRRQQAYSSHARSAASDRGRRVLVTQSCLVFVICSAPFDLLGIDLREISGRKEAREWGDCPLKGGWHRDKSWRAYLPREGKDPSTSVGDYGALWEPGVYV